MKVRVEWHRDGHATKGRRHGVRMTAWKPKTVHGYRFEVKMREKSKEEDATCESVRTVRLFIVDERQVWLHEKDLACGVRYMFVQHQLKGFPSVPDDDAGPGE